MFDNELEVRGHAMGARGGDGAEVTLRGASRRCGAALSDFKELRNQSCTALFNLLPNGAGRFV